jgi:hypothetical protein
MLFKTPARCARRMQLAAEIPYAPVYIIINCTPHNKQVVYISVFYATLRGFHQKVYQKQDDKTIF